jgi:hypothetical protein
MIPALTRMPMLASDEGMKPIAYVLATTMERVRVAWLERSPPAERKAKIMDLYHAGHIAAGDVSRYFALWGLHHA